jgi:hypothetical protein
MASPNREAIDAALAGVERLQRLFFLERMIFLTGAAVAIVLLTAIAVMMIRSGNVGATNWLPLFGSGGLFMATGSGAMLYFNKCLHLLTELVTERDRDA